MAENLSLELEINAQFDKLKDELFGLRNTVKQTGEQVKKEMGESLEKATVQGSQFTSVLRQMREGLEQLFRGNVATGVLTITNAFQRLGEQSTKAAPSIKGVATETAALGAAAGRAAPALGGMGAALALIGGPIGLAVIAVLAAIALAITALVIGANKIIATAKEVGTESRAAFDKLKAGVEAAGGTITLLDRKLSQNLLASVAKVQGAFDRVFLEVLRTSGPALTALLNRIADLIVRLLPLASAIGKGFAAGFDVAVATANTLLTLLERLRNDFAETIGMFATFGPSVISDLFQVKLREAQAASAALAGGGGTTGGFGGGKAGKSAADDLSALELAMNRLNRVTEDTREAFGVSLNAIEEDFGSGADSAEVFFQRVVAEETLFVQRLSQLLAEERKIILARPTLPRQKLNELEELAAKEAAIVNASTARVVEADRKAIEALRKAHEERGKLIDKEVEALEKSKAQWAKYADDVTQALIKIHNQEVDNEAARERMRKAQEDAANENLRRTKEELQANAQLADPTSNINIFGIDPLGELTKLEALKTAGMAALGTLSQAVGTFGGLMKNGLLGVAAAAQQVLATFILTGKAGGAAFKQMAADVLAQIVVMSAVKAIFELAEGLAALANPFLAWSAPLHFAAAKMYGIIAGVAGAAAVGIGAAGGLGGGDGESVGSQFAADQRKPSEVRLRTGTGAPDDPFIPEIVLAFRRQAEAVEKLHDKIDGVSPGDVLMRGVSQRPDAVERGVRQTLASSGDFTRTLGLAIERG